MNMLLKSFQHLWQWRWQLSKLVREHLHKAFTTLKETFPPHTVTCIHYPLRCWLWTQKQSFYINPHLNFGNVACETRKLTNDTFGDKFRYKGESIPLRNQTQIVKLHVGLVNISRKTMFLSKILKYLNFSIATFSQNALYKNQYGCLCWSRDFPESRMTALDWFHRLSQRWSTKKWLTVGLAETRSRWQPPCFMFVDISQEASNAQNSGKCKSPFCMCCKLSSK